jgi:hypothetical protein
MGPVTAVNEDKSTNYISNRAMTLALQNAPTVVKRPIDGKVPPLYKASGTLSNLGKINSPLVNIPVPIGSVVTNTSVSSGSQENSAPIIRLNNSG